MPLPASFPELASLDLFVSVVELGSVSRAAAAHGVSQPSASSRIKHLERQLGMRLLDRGPSGSLPTDAGVVVAGWAETILRAAHELEAGLSAFQAAQAGRLRIVASFTIAEYLLPQWLDRFSRDHPRDSIALEVANSTTVIDRLRHGAADLGFIETPSELDGLDEAIVGNDELVTVVATGASHTCAATADGGLFCWGQNQYGQLGDGTDTSRQTPVSVLLPGPADAVIRLAAGDRHTCAGTERGLIYCWGDNGDGQLGIGRRGGSFTSPQRAAGVL